MLEAKVDHADGELQYEFEGGGDNSKLASMAFGKYDANFSRLNQLQEIAPRDLKCPLPAEGDITVA
jgi:hypothetical protein